MRFSDVACCPPISIGLLYHSMKNGMQFLFDCILRFFFGITNFLPFRDKIMKTLDIVNFSAYNESNFSPRPLLALSKCYMHTWGRSVFRGAIMADKEFKTIDEQIAILEERGLQIPNKEIARAFLCRNNYYRVSGYSLTLRNHDIFTPDTTFQNIIDIYEFDHHLRHILLKYIEVIEVAVKSIYSYEFTKIYGATGYLNPNYFSDIDTYTDIINKANILKKSRLPHEAYLKHFVNELHQELPLWAYVDLLTISNISLLYKISPPNIKKVVAHAFQLPSKSELILERFLKYITIIRNLCAHGSRLYNRLFEQKPWLSKKEQALLIKLPDGTLDNAHLYGFILVMRRLLKPSEFAEMKEELVTLSKKIPFVCLRYYGFREDWETVL